MINFCSTSNQKPNDDRVGCLHRMWNRILPSHRQGRSRHKMHNIIDRGGSIKPGNRLNGVSKLGRENYIFNAWKYSQIHVQELHRSTIADPWLGEIIKLQLLLKFIEIVQMAGIAERSSRRSRVVSAWKLHCKMDQTRQRQLKDSADERGKKEDSTTNSADRHDNRRREPEPIVRKFRFDNFP